MLELRLVKCKKDMLGDVESAVIEDKDGKQMTVTAEQMIKAIENKQVHITGLSINKDGYLYTTQKPNQGKPKTKKAIEQTIRRLELNIEKLENKCNKTADDRDKIIRYKREIMKLRGENHSIETNNWSVSFRVYGKDNIHPHKL